MRHLLITNLITFFFIYPLPLNSALSKNIENQFLITKLEEGLNTRNRDLIKDLFVQDSFKIFDKHYRDFTKKYQKAKWSITTINNYPNKKSLEVKITSSRRIGNLKYYLNSKQTVQINTYEKKIKSYQVLNEESILNTQDNLLSIKIDSPDRVLTGEKYEINLIIEKPLDNSLIASGMIVLENTASNDLTKTYFGLEANQSGGIFKFIQAPLKPGFQTISAIIAHPKGIYSITKKIQVDL